MKKLVLIRHASAKEGSEDLSDFERPLTNSGEKDAAKLVEALLKTNVIPQVIVSSPALRALSTAHIFAEALGLENAEINTEIYEANTGTLLQAIGQLGNQFNIVGLVGHNPGVSNLLYFLTEKTTTMPTAAWVEIELEIDTWDEINSCDGKLIQYQHP